MLKSGRYIGAFTHGSGLMMPRFSLLSTSTIFKAPTVDFAGQKSLFSTSSPVAKGVTWTGDCGRIGGNFRQTKTAAHAPATRGHPWAATRQKSSAQSKKVRKFLRRQLIEPPSHPQTCISASKCEKYNLPMAMSQLTGKGLKCTMTPDAVATTIKDSQVFVLENGTVVAWNMSEEDVVYQLLKIIRPAEINSFSDIETEDMEYVEEATTDPNIRSGMIGDCIYIHGETQEARLRDMLAFSSGLARHTKLSALEVRAEVLIDQVRTISIKMAAGNKLNFSHHSVMKLTGKALQLRAALNLYSGITDTPDVYWTEPELEQLYDLVSRKLDVDPRVDILNRKLDYITDTVGIVKSNLSEKTSLRLEWMIIALITVEVVFELRREFSGAKET